MAEPPALHAILVTYRRPADLRVTLRRLGEQERPPDRLVVVDNAADPGAEQTAAEARASGLTVEYVAAPENLGPAGGIALGMRRILEAAAPEDWVVLVDDDDPPEEPGALARLERFAGRMISKDPRTAGVGLMGARFDWRRGRPVRVPDRELDGVVAVDYVGGNKLPMYRVEAIHQVGPFRPELFFGFDDLEFGLRLGARGYALYVDGGAWRTRRADRGRLGRNRFPSSVLDQPSWRRYYSLRNVIWILRQHGRDLTAAKLALLGGVGKPLANVVRAPRLATRHLRLNWEALRDGWTGRMGRTVEPSGDRSS
jgi:glycosyltransferase involved in cell wall biosynthesis